MFNIIYMTKYLIIAILVLLAVIGVQFAFYRSLSSDYDIAVTNNKAYADNSIQFEMSMRQLGMQMDSISSECLRVKDSLKIKDRKVKEIVYVESTVEKTDTVLFHDTLFCENVRKDTTIGDKWYSLRMHIEYPDEIVVTPEITSEKVMVTSTERQTVNPPRKFFLFRWFQRKHTVTRLDVVENNPYIKNGTVRDYEIIK